MVEVILGLSAGWDMWDVTCDLGFGMKGIFS